MTTNSYLEGTLQVRRALLALQKELLNHLLEGFERENGRAVPPAEWLQMIMLSQRYAWLREMTSLIADVDLLTELREVTAEQASVARTEVERLLFTPDSATEFGKNYKTALMSGGLLLVPHGKLKADVQQLPKQTSDPAENSAARKRWHEQHKLELRQRRS